MNDDVEKIIEVCIEGDTPILMHRYVPGTSSGTANPNDPGGKKKDILGGTDYSDEWVKTALTSLKQSELPVEERDIAMPSANLQACLREAGSKIKIKGNLTAKTAMASGVQLDEIEYPILINGGSTFNIKKIREKNWLHMAGVNIGKSKVDRIRAYVPTPWRITFRMSVLLPEVTKDLIEKVVIMAGARCGLGDWRPSNKTPGNYGRFDLVSCVEVSP